MANDTIYLRNLRPNRVVLLYADLRVVLERRGARQDSTSLPEDALNEPIIARWLRAGMIEQISKQDFFDLQGRVDAYDPETRHPDEPALLSDARKVALPMTPESEPNATVIDTDKIDKKLLSPRVDYVNQPEAKTLDDISPKEVDVGDYHRGETGRPLSLSASERAELELLRRQVAEAQVVKEKPTAKKPAGPKKKSTTTRKSTKK